MLYFVDSFNEISHSQSDDIYYILLYVIPFQRHRRTINQKQNKPEVKLKTKAIENNAEKQQEGLKMFMKRATVQEPNTHRSTLSYTCCKVNT